MFAVLTLIGYQIGKSIGGVSAGQTMAFLTLSCSQLFHVLNIRTKRSVFVSPLHRNKYMIGALLISFLLIALIAFIPPVAAVFKNGNVARKGIFDFSRFGIGAYPSH